VGETTSSFERTGDATVGKGDPRTKRGKIFKGTFGKKRPRRKKKATTAPPPPEA
jgi:30S ribosomal protein S31